MFLSPIAIYLGIKAYYQGVTYKNGLIKAIAGVLLGIFFLVVILLIISSPWGTWLYKLIFKQIEILQQSELSFSIFTHAHKKTISVNQINPNKPVYARPIISITPPILTPIFLDWM